MRLPHSPLGYYGNALGSLSRLDIVDFLYSVQGSGFLICGNYLRKMRATIDHVVPRARSGAHNILNWPLAHRTCNERKGHRMPNAVELERHRQLLARLRWALFRMQVQSLWRRLVRQMTRPKWQR